MKENDYYGHYKAFVNELSLKPGLTLQTYCQENGVVWRRLYDWMRRHHISLKNLYRAYHAESDDTVRAIDSPRSMEFKEVVPEGVKTGRTFQSGNAATINGVCLRLPSGITVSLEECGVEVLSRLITGLAGKGVTDVLA